jgi:hypothetical protein
MEYFIDFIILGALIPSQLFDSVIKFDGKWFFDFISFEILQVDTSR